MTDPAPIRTSDLASIPDRFDPHSTSPEAVFGEYWPDTDPLLQRQLTRELNSWIDGQTRYRLAAEKAMRKGEVKRGSPLRKLVSQWITPLAELIETLRQETTRGRKPRWLTLTAELDAHEIAGTVIEAIITRAASGQPLKQAALAHAIGKAIEQRDIVRVWQRRNPGLLRAYQERLKQAGASSQHKDEVLRHGFNSKVRGSGEGDEDVATWSKQDRAAVGLMMIRASEAATGGRIRLQGDSIRRPGKKAPRNDQSVVILDDETYAWLKAALTDRELRSTTLRPMLVEPLPWGPGSDAGGYYLHVGTATSLVIGEHRSARAVRKRLRTEIPGPVYKALNFLGRTKWRINREVLKVALEAYRANLDIPGLPQSATVPMPRKPVDIDTNEDARRLWRQAKARAIEANIKQRGKALVAVRILTEAESLVDEPAIYFPHHCDFRGRIYPMPSALNIQGPDLARSLLEFAEGGEIQDQDAVDWLAGYVAKTFKPCASGKTFEDRIAWTLDNEPILRRIASDPLSNRQEWLAVADEPWLALAAALEWVRYLDHCRHSDTGKGFITHLPCFIDGSANGIQHFAALARDPDLARLVNLTPSDRPQDLYQVIADEIFASVTKEAAGGDPMAKRWRRVLGTSAPRSLAKPIVMTTPYGVSIRRIMEFAGDVLDELDPKCRVIPLTDRPKAKTWMAKRMKAAVAGRLEAAEEIMTWLKQLAGIAAGHSDRLEWTMPTGWPWVMCYGAKEARRVEVKVHGPDGKVERATVVMQVESETKLSGREQRSAISSNVIHALDASALVFALNLMEERKVSGVANIHDCVGGLATEMGEIGQAVREGFLRLYTEHDPIGSLFESISATVSFKRQAYPAEPPPRGDFGMRDVLASPYFFV